MSKIKVKLNGLSRGLTFLCVPDIDCFENTIEIVDEKNCLGRKKFSIMAVFVIFYMI